MKLTKATIAKILPAASAANLVAMTSEMNRAANPLEDRSPEDKNSHTKLILLLLYYSKRLPLSGFQSRIRQPFGILEFVLSCKLLTVMQRLQVCFFRALRNVVQNGFFNSFPGSNAHKLVNNSHRNYVCGHMVFYNLRSSRKNREFVDLVGFFHIFGNRYFRVRNQNRARFKASYVFVQRNLCK